MEKDNNKMVIKIEEIVRSGKDIQSLVSKLLESSFNELLSEVVAK
jgi:hypothetical protein